MRRAAIVVSAICAAIWLAAPLALLLAKPEDTYTPYLAAVMLVFWGLAVIGLVRGNRGLLEWGAGPRAVVDVLALVAAAGQPYALVCGVFLADVCALLISLEAMNWLDRKAQGKEGVSDGVQVVSFLLGIGKPALAGVVALVASLAVAMVAYLLNIGTSPLLVVAGAGVAAVISLAALLAWTSKTL